MFTLRVVLRYLVLVALYSTVLTEPTRETVNPKPGAAALNIGTSPARRHILARQNVVYCNAYQYCLNSVCCYSSDGYYYLSCMPVDGNCCADSTFCPAGYECANTGGRISCRCSGTTCSQQLVAPESAAVSSSTSVEDSSQPTRTSVSSSKQTDPGNGANNNNANNADGGNPHKGLSTSDKIALGCGIGIGLPATIAGIATCIHQFCS